MSENRSSGVPGRRGHMGGGRFAPGEKPKNFKSSIKKLVKYLGAYKIAIFIVMILAAAATLFSVAGPKIMAKATNALFDGLMSKIAGTGGIDFGYIGKILLFTLGLYIFSRRKLCTGLDNDRNLAEDLLPSEKGYIRKDRPYAYVLL